MKSVNKKVNPTPTKEPVIIPDEAESFDWDRDLAKLSSSIDNLAYQDDANLNELCDAFGI